MAHNRGLSTSVINACCVKCHHGDVSSIQAHSRSFAGVIVEVKPTVSIILNHHVATATMVNYTYQAINNKNQQEDHRVRLESGVVGTPSLLNDDG